MDLAEAVEFDRQAAHLSIQAVRPGMRIFELSSKTGAGSFAIIADDDDAVSSLLSDASGATFSASILKTPERMLVMMFVSCPSAARMAPAASRAFPTIARFALNDTVISRPLGPL